MSICKKGLLLESGIPFDLPLYPGDCNPPRDKAETVKDDWTTASPAAVSTVTSRRQCMNSSTCVQFGD